MARTLVVVPSSEQDMRAFNHMFALRDVEDHRFWKMGMLNGTRLYVVPLANLDAFRFAKVVDATHQDVAVVNFGTWQRSMVHSNIYICTNIDGRSDEWSSHLLRLIDGNWGSPPITNHINAAVNCEGLYKYILHRWCVEMKDMSCLPWIRDIIDANVGEVVVADDAVRYWMDILGIAHEITPMSRRLWKEVSDELHVSASYVPTTGTCSDSLCDAVIYNKIDGIDTFISPAVATFASKYGAGTRSVAIGTQRRDEPYYGFIQACRAAVAAVRAGEIMLGLESRVLSGIARPSARHATPSDTAAQGATPSDTGAQRATPSNTAAQRATPSDTTSSSAARTTTFAASAASPVQHITCGFGNVSGTVTEISGVQPGSVQSSATVHLSGHQVGNLLQLGRRAPAPGMVMSVVMNTGVMNVEPGATGNMVIYNGDPE